MTDRIEGQAEVQCRRCGQRLAAFTQTCHRCGLRIEPGVAYFPPDDASTEPVDDPADGAAAEATAAPSGETAAGRVRLEHKSVSCLPMDLERVARAEAVDGWALQDTTLDPDIPGSIVAHFRRPLRARPAAAPPAARGGGAGGPSLDRAAPRSPAPRQTTPQPAPARSVRRAPDPRLPAGAPQREPTPARDRDPREMLYLVLLVVGFVVLVKELELVGLFIGLFLLPGLIRSVLGMGKDRSRRR